MTGGELEATGTPLRDGTPGAGRADAEVEPRAPSIQSSSAGAARFAHASEAEMARILDFYEVRWEYEPTTFPILWNLDGEVVESFAPDFYLPELDVFLEMTTLKQRLVRKKNRKLRRLRELYPAIRIKLFYARDFRAMMLKYGRLGLAESLSGTLGQVVPERAAVEVPTDEAPPPAPIAAVEDTLPVVLVQDAPRPARPEDRPTPRPAARSAARARTTRARRGRVTPTPSTAGVEDAEA